MATIEEILATIQTTNPTREAAIQAEDSYGRAAAIPQQLSTLAASIPRKSAKEQLITGLLLGLAEGALTAESDSYKIRARKEYDNAVNAGLLNQQAPVGQALGAGTIQAATDQGEFVRQRLIGDTAKKQRENKEKFDLQTQKFALEQGLMFDPETGKFTPMEGIKSQGQRELDLYKQKLLLKNQFSNDNVGNVKLTADQRNEITKGRSLAEEMENVANELYNSDDNWFQIQLKKYVSGADTSNIYARINQLIDRLEKVNTGAASNVRESKVYKNLFNPFTKPNPKELANLILTTSNTIRSLHVDGVIDTAQQLTNDPNALKQENRNKIEENEIKRRGGVLPKGVTIDPTKFTIRRKGQ